MTAMVDAETSGGVVFPLTDLVVEQDGSVIILSHSAGVCKAVTVNESAYSIWKLVDGSRTADDIADIFVRSQELGDANERTVRQDVRGFLEALAGEGCLEFAEATRMEKEDRLG